MATGPKKKSHFFNRGRGVSEFIESRSDEEDQPPLLHPASPSSDLGGGAVASPSYPSPQDPCSGSSTGDSYSSPSPSSSSSYQQPLNPPRRIQTLDSSHPFSIRSLTGQDDRHAPIQYQGDDHSPPQVFSSATGSLSFSGEIERPLGFEEEAEGEATSKGSRGKKRPQQCKLCLNHSKSVEKKGHKWHCPYRDCDCPACTSTRLHSSQMRQLSRSQALLAVSQDAPGGAGALTDPSRFLAHRSSSVQQPRLPTPPTPDLDATGTAPKPIQPFPRQRELEAEMADIIDEDLFNRLKSFYTPRS